MVQQQRKDNEDPAAFKKRHDAEKAVSGKQDPKKDTGGAVADQASEQAKKEEAAKLAAVSANGDFIPAKAAGASLPSWQLWPNIDNTTANTPVQVTPIGQTDSQVGAMSDEERKSTVINMLRNLAALRPDELEQKQRDLIAAGFITKTQAERIQFGQVDDVTMQGMVDLLRRTAVYNSANNMKTVDDVLNEGKLNPPKDPEDIAAARRAAEAAKPTSTKSVKITNAQDARQTLESVLQSKLGRAATSQEISEFVGLLNQAEKDHPVVTNAQGDATLPGGSSSEQYGGVNAGQMAEDFAAKGGRGAEAGSHTILSYMGAFNQMISTPGGMA